MDLFDSHCLVWWQIDAKADFVTRRRPSIRFAFAQMSAALICERLSVCAFARLRACKFASLLVPLAPRCVQIGMAAGLMGRSSESSLVVRLPRGPAAIQRAGTRTFVAMIMNQGGQTCASTRASIHRTQTSPVHMCAGRPAWPPARTHAVHHAQAHKRAFFAAPAARPIRLIRQQACRPLPSDLDERIN